MFQRVRAIAVIAFLLSLYITDTAQAATTCVSKSTNHGGYIYTAFKNAGTACTWDVPIGISAVDMLVVAGGGGGGPRHGGGGGAGGVIKASTVALTNINSLSITVGAGGAGGYLSGSYVEGFNGSNSIVEKWIGAGAFTTRTAVGGGRGSQSSPLTGGSGGGTYGGSGAAGTAGQGSSGAAGGLTNGWYGGGGGGAGGAGTAGSQFGGGAGGAGTTWLSSFDTTTATRLRLTNLTGYFGGGGGGGFASNSGAYNGGVGGVGGGGNGGGRGLIGTCGVVGSKGCDGEANTGGGGGSAGQQYSPSADSTGGTGGSGVVIFRYTITETIELSNYAAATSCIWNAGMDYAFLFTAGTGNAVTKMKMQFASNSLDVAFESTRLEIWTNNSGATGSRVGSLYPSNFAASATAPGATVATRVGTYIGSVPLSSATQYWFVLKNGGYTLTACQAGAMVTQANSWAMVLNSGNYNMRVSGSYTTYGLNIMAFEMSTGTPDYLEPEITGPNSSTGSSVSTNITENSAFSHTYLANETVTWTLGGTDTSLFAISTAGVLSMPGKNFESPGDANQNNIYQITITATDLGGNATSQDLSLTIDDDNEFPYFLIGGITHAVNVAENQTSILTYNGADPDTQTTLTWSISGGVDSNKFGINGSTGVLTFLNAQDFESPTDSDLNNTYLVTISLSDGVNQEDQSLTVTVTNVNEIVGIAKPTISGLIYKGVAVQITVIAENSGKVRFFINGKRIPGCLAVATSGNAPTSTATCTFKPAIQGVHVITARITPSNTALTGTTSPQLFMSVLRRSSNRTTS